MNFNLPSNWWLSQLQKSEFAVLDLGFEILGLRLDNRGRTTKNAYRPIYSLWDTHATRRLQRLWELGLHLRDKITRILFIGARAYIQQLLRVHYFPPSLDPRYLILYLVILPSSSLLLVATLWSSKRWRAYMASAWNSVFSGSSDRDAQ